MFVSFVYFYFHLTTQAFPSPTFIKNSLLTSSLSPFFLFLFCLFLDFLFSFVLSLFPSIFCRCFFFSYSFYSFKIINHYLFQLISSFSSVCSLMNISDKIKQQNTLLNLTISSTNRHFYEDLASGENKVIGLNKCLYTSTNFLFFPPINT